MSLKKDKKFKTDCEKYLTSIGAVRNDEQMYPWSVETILGTLRISIPEEHGKVFTIFTSFQEAKRASEKMGFDKCNPFTGKWNFHECTPEACLNAFMWDLNNILVK